MPPMKDVNFEELRSSIRGEIRLDTITKTLYSTDASMYKETPLGVVWPDGEDDLKLLIKFARKNKIGLILRGAGTSLAGQVVGSGLVVDISRNMNRILEYNVEERWVRVQPGVIFEEMNREMMKHGLFFGPETSTANRCTIGGMLGNNACGLHSLRYGSTRDHTLEVKVLLSDGSEATFGNIGEKDLKEKIKEDSLEGKIYSQLDNILSDKNNARIIREEYPDPGVPRRNTGYALDLLLNSKPYTRESENELNLSRLIAGSEGTLAIATEIKLNLVTLPPP